MFDLAAVQAAIRDQQLDGWLLYDFRGHQRARPAGRRPRREEALPPLVLLRPRGGRAAEARPRDRAGVARSCCRGRRPSTAAGRNWKPASAELVAGAKRVAMEYSPRNANPYISRVDAGTIELVRSFGVEVVSSGDLIQQFEATWDDDQGRSHLEAAKHTDAAYGVAWGFIADADPAARARRPNSTCRSGSWTTSPQTA